MAKVASTTHAGKLIDCVVAYCLPSPQHIQRTTGDNIGGQDTSQSLRSIELRLSIRTVSIALLTGGYIALAHEYFLYSAFDPPERLCFISDVVLNRLDSRPNDKYEMKL